MKYKVLEEGACPICGERLCYGATDLNDGYIVYEWTCPDCGTIGQEVFKLTFAGHDVYNKETGEYEILEVE